MQQLPVLRLLREAARGRGQAHLHEGVLRGGRHHLLRQGVLPGRSEEQEDVLQVSLELNL